MLKRIVIAIISVTCLVLATATPAFADSVPNAPYGPPLKYPYGPVTLDELVPGLGHVHIDGFGSLTAHVVKLETPGKNPTAEESWFEVSSFQGIIVINGIPTLYSTPVTNVRVTVHFGGQPSQPLITLRSSEPFLIPVLSAYYSMVQMVGGDVVFAR